VYVKVEPTDAVAATDAVAPTDAVAGDGGSSTHEESKSVSGDEDVVIVRDDHLDHGRRWLRSNRTHVPLNAAGGGFIKCPHPQCRNALHVLPPEQRRHGCCRVIMCLGPAHREEDSRAFRENKALYFCADCHQEIDHNPFYKKECACNTQVHTHAARWALWPGFAV
jgi:hypothetical protein